MSLIIGLILMLIYLFQFYLLSWLDCKRWQEVLTRCAAFSTKTSAVTPKPDSTFTLVLVRLLKDPKSLCTDIFCFLVWFCFSSDTWLNLCFNAILTSHFGSRVQEQLFKLWPTVKQICRDPEKSQLCTTQIKKNFKIIFELFIFFDSLAAKRERVHGKKCSKGLQAGLDPWLLHHSHKSYRHLLNQWPKPVPVSVNSFYSF